jgi:hypothetical protein
MGERQRERMAGWEEAGILELGEKAESQQMISGSQQEAALEWGMSGQTQWLESLGSVG